MVEGRAILAFVGKKINHKSNYFYLEHSKLGENRESVV